ncbi:TIR domain-containing protein [Desulfococcaceae bacterium HSG9]|nr:TIR domain-containing protein [Desulfococcaceae bacterium HSG9]
MEESKMKVFISYAREDLATAQKLYKDIKNVGAVPWMDEYDLLPGQNWKIIINQVLKKTSYVLVLLSSRSLSKRGYVQKEMKIALNLLDEFPPDQIFVIPVRLDECNPVDERLQNIHHINLFPDYENGLNQIVRAIQAKGLQPSEQPPETQPLHDAPNSGKKPGAATPQFDLSERIKILFLGANPTDNMRLRLDEEVRSIDQALLSARFRDRFDFLQEWAVQTTDLPGILMRHEPNVVHFSGHGSSKSEIMLENSLGQSMPVPPRTLSKLFAVLRGHIRCVVLNACYSEDQAKSIAEHIDCVIGMSDAIGDRAAINFVSAFYQALAYGKNIKTAFDLGCIQIDLAGLAEGDKPRLIQR